MERCARPTCWSFVAAWADSAAPISQAQRRLNCDARSVLHEYSDLIPCAAQSHPPHIEFANIHCSWWTSSRDLERLLRAGSQRSHALSKILVDKIWIVLYWVAWTPMSRRSLLAKCSPTLLVKHTRILQLSADWKRGTRTHSLFSLCLCCKGTNSTSTNTVWYTQFSFIPAMHALEANQLKIKACHKMKQWNHKKIYGTQTLFVVWSLNVSHV